MFYRYSFILETDVCGELVTNRELSVIKWLYTSGKKWISGNSQNIRLSQTVFIKTFNNCIDAMEGGVTNIGWFFNLSIKILDYVEIQIVLEKKIFIYHQFL